MSRVPAAVDQAAFRIVQEALTNVVRHAGDAAATVRVRSTAGGLLVEVSDDGSATPIPSPGSGIRGMGERARSVGGPGRGPVPAAGGVLMRSAAAGAGRRAAR